MGPQGLAYMRTAVGREIPVLKLRAICASSLKSADSYLLVIAPAEASRCHCMAPSQRSSPQALPSCRLSARLYPALVLSCWFPKPSSIEDALKLLSCQQEMIKLVLRPSSPGAVVYHTGIKQRLAAESVPATFGHARMQ